MLCLRVCHPWTLDFGIHAEMTGLQHLCITMSAGAWETISGLFIPPVRLHLGELFHAATLLG